MSKRESLDLMTLWLRAKRDPLVLDIARVLEERGFRIDVEDVEALVAKLRPAPKDDARAFINEYDEKIEARNQAGIMRLITPAMQREMEARAILREVDACADERKRRGEDNSRMQAWEDVAERRGRSSAALRKRVQRGR